MILHAQNLSKVYKKKKALDGISIDISAGQCFGILGKNGAGKSTFIKLTLGLIFPTSGSIEVFGVKSGINNRKIGYLSENLTIYPHLSAKENLLVAAYSSNYNISETYIEECLTRLSLENVGSKPAKSFSLGMKRRLQLGMATMTKPIELLILDEPTNGLDVDGCLWLRNYLAQLKKQGVSIIMASHSMADLEACITHYTIFDKGKILYSGVWKENDNTSSVLIDISPKDRDSYINVFENGDVKFSFVSESRIQVDSKMSYKEILNLITKNGLSPEYIDYKKNTLEEIFVKLTGGNNF